jgi:hypothetical protein
MHHAYLPAVVPFSRLVVCICVPQQKDDGSHPGSSANKFDKKTDKGSADLYFHYYGMLQHQQNMLQVGGYCCLFRPSTCARWC